MQPMVRSYIYPQNWVIYGINVGIHIPAPWVALMALGSINHPTDLMISNLVHLLHPARKNEYQKRNKCQASSPKKNLSFHTLRNWMKPHWILLNPMMFLLCSYYGWHILMWVKRQTSTHFKPAASAWPSPWGQCHFRSENTSIILRISGENWKSNMWKLWYPPVI